MVYDAHILNFYLKNLALVGQDEEGRLEFVGTVDQWDSTDVEKAIENSRN